MAASAPHPSDAHPLNPVYQFLDISTNEPILAGRAGPEPIDARNDVFAPFKLHKYSRRLWAALLAEFLGLCIFQIYGGSANDDVAALANGITLAVIVYATANVSGGHLNPAVTFANCLTGHMSWSKGGVYVVAQLLGSIFGALVESGLMPGVSPGSGAGPGCFTHTKGVQISAGQLFWWECIMTFVLVSVVYATAVTKPGHGSHAPLAIGFTLYTSAAVGGPYTGAALNPARVLGPTLVFDCYWGTAFVYVFAQLLAGFAAAVLVLPLYGFGQFGSLFDTRIFSWLGVRVPHRFQKLPETDVGPPQPPPFTVAQPPAPSARSAYQEGYPPQTLGGGMEGPYGARASKPSPFSQTAGARPAPPSSPAAANPSDFLPDNWKLGPR